MSLVRDSVAVGAAKASLRAEMRSLRAELKRAHDADLGASERLARTLFDFLELEVAERERPVPVSNVGRYDEPTHIAPRKTLGDLWPAHPTNDGSLASQLSPTRTIEEARAYAEKLVHALPSVALDVRRLLGLPAAGSAAAVRAEKQKAEAAQAEAAEQKRPALTIGVYSAIGSELSLAPFVKRVAETEGLPAIHFAAPIVLGPERMEFIEVTAAELLDPAASGLAFLVSPAKPSLPPLNRRFVACTSIDLLLVPGLAFAEDGARLGYGGGYYDAYLAMLAQQKAWAGQDMGSWPQPNLGYASKAVGVCFAEQLLPAGRVPATETDIRLDAVATPSGIVALG